MARSKPILVYAPADVRAELERIGKRETGNLSEISTKLLRWAARQYWRVGNWAELNESNVEPLKKVLRGGRRPGQAKVPEAPDERS